MKHLEGDEASDRFTSGSPLWKKAQLEVRQHYFIDSYIAAYIQVLYKGGGVHPNWFDGQ